MTHPRVRYALGGGFELAPACDIIIASEQAIFGLSEVRLGLVPGAGGAFRLARQLPLKKAMGHLLTGRQLDARTAERFGLVNEVVPLECLDECVAGWADDLVRSAPLSVREIKEAVLKSVDMPLDQAFATRFGIEADPAQGLETSDDHGADAFTDAVRTAQELVVGLLVLGRRLRPGRLDARFPPRIAGNEPLSEAGVHVTMERATIFHRKEV